MSVIKTEMYTAVTDHDGNLKIGGNQAFNGVFNLGFILGARNVIDKRIPTDEKGLQIMQDRLESMARECLWGLAGIGAIIGAANPAELSREDLSNIGVAITNLANLGSEATDHIESINVDINRREKKAAKGTGEAL